MAVLGLCAFAILTVVGAALSILLASEFAAWAPRLIDYLIRRAVQSLPPEKQARYDEEWRGHLNETPGDLSKLFTCLSMQWASYKMADRRAFPRPLKALSDALRLKEIFVKRRVKFVTSIAAIGFVITEIINIVFQRQSLFFLVAIWTSYIPLMILGGYLISKAFTALASARFRVRLPFADRIRKAPRRPFD